MSLSTLALFFIVLVIVAALVVWVIRSASAIARILLTTVSGIVLLYVSLWIFTEYLGIPWPFPFDLPMP